MSKKGKKDNFKNIHPKDPGIGRFMFMMIHRVKRTKVHFSSVKNRTKAKASGLFSRFIKIEL